MGKKKYHLTDDQKRETLLDFLYDVYRNSRSRKSVRKTATEVYKGVKDKGLNTKDVGASLHYLHEEGWISIDIITKEYTTDKGHVVPSTQEFYYINKNGIDRKEDDSAFRLEQNYHGINISNLKDSVVVIGPHNKTIVAREYAQVGNELYELHDKLLESDALDDGQKLAVVSDIESLIPQLKKADPDRTIIQKSWNTIKDLGQAAGFLELVSRIAQGLAPFLG